MDASTNETDKKLGAFPFVIGGMSYIPLIGVLFGVIAIIYGLVTDRRGGKKLALIGAGGIGLSILIYGSLFYFGMFQRGGVFDDLRSKLAQSTINQLVQSIEVYKLVHGAYPASLEELQKSSPNVPILIYDPMDVTTKPPRYFYYERVGNDRYLLRGAGIDGKPFTPDDILPQVDASSANKLGLLIDPPTPR